MNKYDLSILIPARNEEFLARTVAGILENIRGNTEVIVALDGVWADPALAADPRLTIIYFPKSIGQRAATNQACRLSKAKYVMKIDAHCIVEEGFDVKLMAIMKDNYTVVPTLYNLHAFDWVCSSCGDRVYQGPTHKYKKCDKCGGTREREMIWKPRFNRRSRYYRFDKTLHFQYWGSYEDRPEAQGDLVPILSTQGSCFMLTRAKYWELGICDEAHGSWGQQGVEVACKTWLSGGELYSYKGTWYSHLFRTQGGDFAFPYPMSGTDQEHAREYSRDLWLNDKWPLAIHSFDWLIEKFKPIPDWHDDISREIIFYTDNKLKLKYAHMVQKQLQKIGLPITSASLKPMANFGNNIYIPLERGLLAYFAQIIAALQNSKADIVYMCEHDVIYHPTHFDFIPERKDIFYYNQNFWRIRPEQDNFAVHWDANQVSGLVCYREPLLNWYKAKFEQIVKSGFDRSYEPGNRDPNLIQTWKSHYPNVDIRHGGNLTKSKWSLDDFRDKSTSKGWDTSIIEQIPGWDYTLADFR